MNRTHLMLGALAALTAPLSAQAPETWACDSGTGFSAEAAFRLIDATTLEVVVRNTSETIPAEFGGAGIILTGVSWDFDGATSIFGGMAKTGSASASVGFSTMVGGNADVSGEWGWGNAGATGMYPNMISANQSHMTPFGGANLDGPANLAGPSGGVVSMEGAGRLGGQGAIQDEIVVTLALTDAVANLGFLSNGVRFEWGSDALFCEAGPTCDIEASIVEIPDQNGFNANGTLYATNAPVLGTTTTFCFDDPGGACSLDPGSSVLFYYSRNTASLPIGFGGCGGGPAEVLIDPTNLYGLVGPLTWTGPGTPACFDVPVPNAADKCGAEFFAQGVFVGPSGVTLTNGLAITLGL